MTRYRNWRMYLILGIMAGIFISSSAYATIIYPGDPNWYPPDLIDKGNGYISASNPRSGNASLFLTTTGSMTDWAFFNRYAGNDRTAKSSWGLLSNVTGLSFDWYRQDIIPNPDIAANWPDTPWLAQTPVLRLYVYDSNNLKQFSELVWEQYYTDSTPSVTDQWVRQDVMTQNPQTPQNLWRHVFGEGYTVAGGVNKDPFYPDPLLTLPISSWATTMYSSNAYVFGIGVGVGSQWPDKYVGYVDNVMLSFTGSTFPVVNDNFELPVPEPSSLVLLMCGLALLTTGGFIRHRRRRAVDRVSLYEW